MDVLIIGGTRYFGRSAVEQLLEAGHQPRALRRALSALRQAWARPGARALIQLLMDD